MHDHARRWPHRWIMLGLLGALAGVFAFPASPAFAHGQLALSEPARDSTVSQPLDSLLLYYTEKPAQNAYFTLTSPTGIRLDGSWSHAEPKQLDKPIQEYFVVNGVWEPRLYHVGFPVRLTVAYWPEQGLYTAHYLSVASDGEPVRGEVRFSYNGPTSSPPAGWQAPTSQPDPALLAAAEGGGAAGGGAAAGRTGGPTAATQTASSASAPGTSVWVWVLPALLLIGVGVIIVRAGRRPNRRT